MINSIGLYRRIKRISQSSLAHQLGVSQPLVYRWEYNYAQPDAEKQIKIAQILDIAPDILFGELPVDPNKAIEEACHLK